MRKTKCGKKTDLTVQRLSDLVFYYLFSSKMLLSKSRASFGIW